MDAGAAAAAALSDAAVVLATGYGRFHDGACSNAYAGANDAVVLAEVVDGAVVVQPGPQAFLHYFPSRSQNLKQSVPQ